MPQQLEGKIAVITGGTSGIGLATARLFIAEGATVVVTGSSERSVADAKEALGDAALVRRSDAGDPASIAALIAEVGERFGRIDVLFLNAGIARFGPLGAFTEEDFDAVLRVNLKGPWLTLSRALPLLPEGAAVIVNTSAVNRKGMPGAAVYAASKAGLRAMVRSAAMELSPRGVRINALSPGPVETPIYGKVGMGEAEVKGFTDQVVQQVPLGRFGRPEELARAALFLATPASSFVQGIELDVDGGMAQV
jgi:NAD(P)-dependent dehydrogenase (short-subunit alcohol dehydrogenase family)